MFVCQQQYHNRYLKKKTQPFFEYWNLCQLQVGRKVVIAHKKKINARSSVLVLWHHSHSKSLENWHSKFTEAFVCNL